MCRHGPPELVVRCKHSAIPVPVLARRRHEIGEPVQELKRRELDDAVRSRSRRLAAATGSDPDAEWSRFHENPIGLRGPEGDAENLPFTRAALAMMENLDANVGRVLTTLDAIVIADDTILVFLSDNGPNSSRWCGGLRGRKGSTDDGGVRSVCCVRWPGRIRPGTRIPQLAAAIDLLPTLAGLAGVALGPTHPLDGIDLSVILLGRAESDAVAQQAAARTIQASFGGKVSVRSQTHRLDADGRLYDVTADPGQTRDLAAELPDEAARLGAIAAAWRRDVLTAVPPPIEERFPVGSSGAPHTELPARDGIPHGGVRRSSQAPNCSSFTNWKTLDDSITWTVDVVTAGRYDALLWYTCPEADAGSTITLACGPASTQASIHTGWNPPLDTNHDRVPRTGEGFNKEFRPLALGQIELAAGPTTLTLRATAIPGSSVADVRRLVLVPSDR